jgi:hypothetical protein
MSTATAPICSSTGILQNKMCIQDVIKNPITCSDSNANYDAAKGACIVNTNSSISTNNGCPNNYMILPTSGGSMTIGSGSSAVTTAIPGICVIKPVCLSGYTATVDKSGLSWQCTTIPQTCPKGTTYNSSTQMCTGK